MEKYNLKIKEYNNQITASLYNNPVMIQDKIDNIVIQLKKYRTSISELLIDNQDGTGVYGCWKQQLEDEINMVLFDEDMEHLKSYVSIRVPNIYTANIVTDYEREQKSLITSLNRTKGKVCDIAYANEWDLFVTLTFDDTVLMKKYGDFAVNYEVCVKALHSFFTSLKNQVPELQYLGVPELHHTYYDIQTMKAVDFNGKALTEEVYQTILEKENRTQAEQGIIQKVMKEEYKRRFHFHFLFNNLPERFLVDSGEKTKKGQTIYNLLNYNKGFTTATYLESLQAAQHYITKYITKDLMAVSKGKKRYWASKNVNKPKEQNIYLENEDYADMKNDIDTSVSSDTRKKVIDVEVKNFSNRIYKYVLLNSEILSNEILSEYVDFSERYGKVYNYNNYTLKQLEGYFNSAFCPFLHVNENNEMRKKEMVYFLNNNEIYIAKLQNGIYTISKP